MNVQPWAMYTPQAYQPYPLAGIPGGFAPGIGGAPWAQQSLMGHWLSGLAGLPGQGLGHPFGYPQQLGSLGGLLPFYAVPGTIPGVWGGLQAGPFVPQGLLGTPFGQGIGGLFGYPQVGQLGYPQVSQGLSSLGGLLPFYAAPPMAPGVWSGQQPYIAGQLAHQGLMGNLLGGLAGHAGQPIGGFPPFQATPGLAAVA